MPAWGGITLRGFVYGFPSQDAGISLDSLGWCLTLIWIWGSFMTRGLLASDGILVAVD